MNRRSGQALPIIALAIAVVLSLTALHTEKWFTGVEKMKRQRQADQDVMALANQQARALNAIAALNQGLRIALKRGYAVGAAILALSACSFFYLPCSAALTELSLQAIPFYRKLNQLGAILAQQQDEIANWAAVAPARMIYVSNLTDLSQWSFLFPGSSQPPVGLGSTRLRIRRYGSEAFSQLGASPEEVEFAGKQDMVRCESHTFNRFLEFDQKAKRGSFDLGKNNQIEIEYVSSHGTSKKTFKPKNRSELSSYRKSRQSSGKRLVFSRARYRKCESLKDVLLKFASVVPVLNLPPPYILDATFFSDGNRFGLAQAGKREKLITQKWPMSPSAGQREPTLWVLSEAEIRGSDLSQMNFEPALVPTTLGEDLHNKIQKQFLGLAARQFDVPSAEEFGVAP